MLNPEKIILDDVIRGLKITREELVKVAILVGTDFNSGVKGIGAKTALKIIQKQEFESVVTEKMPETDYQSITDFFLNPPVRSDYSLKWDPPDQDGILKMLCGTHDFSEERVKKALEGLGVKTGQKTLDSWF